MTDTDRDTRPDTRTPTRLRRSRCHVCAYRLDGTTTRCPECGTPVSEAEVPGDALALRVQFGESVWICVATVTLLVFLATSAVVVYTLEEIDGLDARPMTFWLGALGAASIASAAFGVIAVCGKRQLRARDRRYLGALGFVGVVYALSWFLFPLGIEFVAANCVVLPWLLAEPIASLTAMTAPSPRRRKGWVGLWLARYAPALWAFAYLALDFDRHAWIPAAVMGSAGCIACAVLLVREVLEWRSGVHAVTDCADGAVDDEGAARGAPMRAPVRTGLVCAALMLAMNTVGALGVVPGQHWYAEFEPSSFETRFFNGSPPAGYRLYMVERSSAFQSVESMEVWEKIPTNPPPVPGRWVLINPVLNLDGFARRLSGAPLRVATHLDAVGDTSLVQMAFTPEEYPRVATWSNTPGFAPHFTPWEVDVGFATIVEPSFIHWGGLLGNLLIAFATGAGAHLLARWIQPELR